VYYNNHYALHIHINLILVILENDALLYTKTNSPSKNPTFYFLHQKVGFFVPYKLETNYKINIHLNFINPSVFPKKEERHTHREQ